ncbi:diadenosine tetraphosphate hydrolase [Micromonospora sp. NPDC000089]|uniref:diadenosine tetraphosphate hydrolase n=1 Tax=unclassified Micromonospora TaxID=2617518 RepID=UPI0036C83E64
MTGDWRDDRIGAALRGENPTVLRRLSAGFAVIGDNQFLPGYCVLMTDDPRADRLADLPRERRLAFLADVDLLGAAVQRVYGRRDPAFLRINYEILGNLDAFLHAHVRPRYGWEPADLRRGPVYGYPAEVWRDPAHGLAARHDVLRAELVAELDRLVAAD